MPFVTCNHTKIDGKPCQSPAVRGEELCYYHGRALERAKVVGRSTNINYVVSTYDEHGNPILEPYPSPGHNTFHLGLLDDPDSIQVGISSVLHAISTNTIDLPRADRLLYGLKLAAINIRNTARNLPANTDRNHEHLAAQELTGDRPTT